ncbi:GPW/gp25 family protein [Paenibacillus azoreducens]|uniref:GPW/gp25 family protein n=1 Tax=Paenibacillus azoreducens TaxID=116718 RepID=UPI0039F4E983
MANVVKGSSESIDFGATGLDEISQNIRTILTTIQGTVPLDRGLGIDITVLDNPTELAKAQLTAHVYDVLEEYEPRAEVLKVEFEEDAREGKLIPIVKYRLKEGESDDPDEQYI